MFKYLLLALALSSAAQAQEAEQIQLARRLFRTPAAGWTPLLQENRNLLTADFFYKCQLRIDWDLEHGLPEDARNFAHMADRAAEVMGQPVHFQQDLEARR